MADLPVILGAVVVLFWVITAATAQYWAPYDPLDFVGKRLQPPSAQHWLGTDALGRDVFTRTLYGAWHSMPIAVIVVLVGAFIGVTLGAIAGFFGGLADPPSCAPSMSRCPSRRCCSPWRSPLRSARASPMPASPWSSSGGPSMPG